MAEPSARVVDLEGNGEVAVAWERGDVAARWVGEVELCGTVDVGANFLPDDPKVVAVEVDRVVEATIGLVLAWDGETKGREIRREEERGGEHTRNRWRPG